MRTLPDKLMNRKDCYTKRKTLRNHMTPAEKELWKLIKHSQVENLKFRRQQSIGVYIVDFYCPEIRLVIELDGQVHVENEAYDEQRSVFIEHTTGIHILRYENRFVFEHPDCVLEDIKEYKDRWVMKNKR